MYLEKAEKIVKEKTGGQELQHYLRVLEDWNYDDFADYPLHIDWRATWLDRGCVTVTVAKGHPQLNKEIVFNLATGKPATGKDAENYLKLIQQ